MNKSLAYCLAYALGLLFSLAAEAVPGPVPDSVRPGAVRPGERNQPPISVSRDDEEPAGVLLAGGPALPDAVRPGAIRPGEETPKAQPQAPGPQNYEVPRVVDRPLDIDSGDKVVVTRFNVVGAQDRPDQGITVGEVEALVENLRAQRPEGFTVGRLQEVANEVTKYYRGKGLILAQAFIPVQTVDSGVVNLEILEGKLGRVVMEGNQKYNTDILNKPFADLIGQPVTKEATEAALLRLTDYPGLGLFGVFQPGQEVGTADMVIKVQKEDRFDGSLRYDNHGLRETGIRRGHAQVSWNNPTNNADKLTASFQATHVPANLLYWAVDYEAQVFAPENRVEVGFSRNVFDVGGEFASRDISSFTENGHLAVARSIIRGRQLNLSASLGYDRKQAITHVGNRDQSRDDLSVVTAGIDFDNVDTKFAGLNSVHLEYNQGFNNLLGAMGGQNEVNTARANNKPSRQGGSRDFATGAFHKVFFAGSRLQSMAAVGKLFGKAEWFKGQSLMLRGEAQWSPSLLVPLEQYAIGGPNNVRAYQPTERLFDKAMFLSMEYIINAPGMADIQAFGGKTWGELVQLSFFYDVAFGRLNDPTTQEIRDGTDTQNLKGAGLSLSFNLPDKFATRLTFANQIGDPRPTNKRSPQVWLDFNYMF